VLLLRRSDLPGPRRFSYNEVSAELKAPDAEGPHMKPNIHPEYVETTVSCACGNKFVTGSTRKKITVDICSACHPFFTGKMKYVDTTGRIDKFNNKYNWGNRKKAGEGAAEPAK
jgi:large subunit ribosomal protein L31